MTKKEFKKKCKEEKSASYKLMLLGDILAIIGAILVAITMFLINEFNMQICGYVLGGISAFIGMILDIAGEINLSKEYKEYKK